MKIMKSQTDGTPFVLINESVHKRYEIKNITTMCNNEVGYTLDEWLEKCDNVSSSKLEPIDTITLLDKETNDELLVAGFDYPTFDVIKQKWHQVLVEADIDNKFVVIFNRERRQVSVTGKLLSVHKGCVYEQIRTDHVKR